MIDDDPARLYKVSGNVSEWFKRFGEGSGEAPGRSGDAGGVFFGAFILAICRME